MSAVNLSRRHFLKSTAVVGGGLVVGFSLGGCAEAPLPIVREQGAFVPNAFLQLGSDNRLTFYVPRDEMGQGVTTGLTTLVAEEFDYDPQKITLAFAGVHEDYNNPGMGVQATGGSNAINAHYDQLRSVGADTRALILNAAAKDLGVTASALQTEDGHVIHGDERLPYGRFIATAAGMKMPEGTPVKDPSQFRYIGVEAPRLDAIAKSTGTAEFGIDVEIPNLHRAVVRRSPVAGARVTGFDKQKALAMPGVTDVIEISSGVAVVAEKYWQAKQAADTLEVDFEDVPLARVDSATVRTDYEAAMAESSGIVSGEDGDVDAGFSGADEVIEGQYWTPYLSHAPLEPMNAVLRIENGEADLWSGNQGPTGAQGLVARFSGLPAEKVRVHNTYMGGAFGRRGVLTHIIEVTEIAVAANKPVQLIWTREDDLRHGVYRPASLMRIRAGINSAGHITAWDAKRVGANISPDLLQYMLPGLFPGLGEGTVGWLVNMADKATTDWFTDPSSIEGIFEDYDFETRRVTHTTVDHGVPVSFWRSVGHSYTAFAKESMMDELAVLAGADPVEFRVQNTNMRPRLQNVIRVAGERMKQMTPAAGRHLGFAAHHSFLTDVAEIAEVSVENGKIRVHKVTCVVDCGTVVNPDIVRAQMEGGIMFGLTAALHGNHELRNGEFQETNFHNYPILRMDEAPEVDVVIIDSGTEPTGVGEPGLPPIAPAVANAVFRATGQRLRSLPLKLEA